MIPTYKSDSVLLINKTAYWFANPRKNDVVVLRDPRSGREILKRIIAVKNSRYFVQGDNNKESTDSREFGLIEKKDIVGKVIYKVD